MLDFTDEQKAVQAGIRAWCAKNLEPAVPELEAGTLSVYPLMRAMATTFGLADMAKAAFERARTRHDSKEKGAGRGRRSRDRARSKARTKHGRGGADARATRRTRSRRS